MHAAPQQRWRPWVPVELQVIYRPLQELLGGGVAQLRAVLQTVWNTDTRGLAPSNGTAVCCFLTTAFSFLSFLFFFFLRWGGGGRGVVVVKLFNGKGMQTYGYFVDQQDNLISFILGYGTHIRLPLVSQISTFYLFILNYKS